jgi:hypothetical protein
MLYRAYLALAGFELTTSVMIGSYKSSHHTIMITTAFCLFILTTYKPFVYLKECKSLIEGLPFQKGFQKHVASGL